MERERGDLRETEGQIGTDPSDEACRAFGRLKAKHVSTRDETSAAIRKLGAKWNASYREEEGQAFSVAILNPRGKR